MKYIYTLIILLTSFILSACDANQNSEYTPKVNYEENSSNIVSGENAKRISYNEFVQQYTPPENNEPFTNNSDSNVKNEGKNDSSTNSQANDANYLATYSTPLLNSSKERVNNLEIVCARLNNFILEPNQTFSYNNVAGPYGQDDGFQEATILLSDGTKTKGYGGRSMPIE